MKQFIFLLIGILPFFAVSQTENFWTKKTDFPGLKRERAVAFAIGDYGYICSGVDSAEVVLNDLWQYNPANDTWTQKANLPGSVRRDAIAFAINSKGYVGTGIDNDESMLGTKLNDFWEYNPTTNTWTQKADFPGSGGLGIYFATGFNIDSKGYICGGKTGPNTYTSQFWEYKPSIDEWTQRTNFPGGVRYQLSSFSVGYYGYVGLGANQDVFKKDFWKYNGGTNEWTQIANLPAWERGGACTFSIGESGFVCLGSNGGVLSDLWEYKPELNEWFVRATYGGSERKNAVSFVVNNRAYVGTGKGISGKKASMYEYTPKQELMAGISQLNTVEFSLYPNPSNGSFQLQSNSKNIETLRICTTDGRCIETIKYNGIQPIVLNRSDFSNGIYFVSCVDQNGSVLGTQQLMLY